MTFQKGKKPWHSENFLVTHLYYDMQRVRAVQSCMAVLYEPANWCYICTGNIILWI